MQISVIEESIVSGPYSIPFKVRDYECDIQGIVNNSVYQNYLEHARHEFLLNEGIDFADLTESGVHLIVIRAELDYKKSLISGDSFYVTVCCQKNGRIRFDFIQNIYRKSDDALVLKAKITGTSINKSGRPVLPEAIQALCLD